jgi:hypothetical protein
MPVVWSLLACLSARRLATEVLQRRASGCVSLGRPPMGRESGLARVLKRYGFEG